MTVCIMNAGQTGYKHVFENVKQEDVELMAQLAMVNKSDYELVFILPGNNRGIKNKPDEYKKALEISKKYKSDGKFGEFEGVTRLKEKIKKIRELWSGLNSELNV